MPEVKFVIKSEADLSGIKATSNELGKLNKVTDETTAATGKATTALKTKITAVELLNKAFSRLKSVMLGIAWGAVAAGVAYLANWIFNLVTGLDKAEAALENFKLQADEARAAKRRMADEVKRSKDALDEELDALKAIEEQQNKALKRAKDFELGKGGTLTESQKVTERKRIRGVFDAAIDREKAAERGTDTAAGSQAAMARIRFLEAARDKRIKMLDSPEQLTPDQLRNKEFAIEREFADKAANVSLQSQESQLAAVTSPINEARQAEAAARERFNASKGAPQDERNNLLTQLMFAQQATQSAEKEFGPKAASLRSSINETRADAASNDLLLRTQQELANTAARMESLAKQQLESDKRTADLMEERLRLQNSRSRTSRD
jgi:hypothetical protein